MKKSIAYSDWAIALQKKQNMIDQLQVIFNDQVPSHHRKVANNKVIQLTPKTFYFHTVANDSPNNSNNDFQLILNLLFTLVTQSVDSLLDGIVRWYKRSNISLFA